MVQQHRTLERNAPFCLKLLKDLPFGMITNDLDVDEASKIQALRSELRHDSSFELRGHVFVKLLT